MRVASPLSRGVDVLSGGNGDGDDWDESWKLFSKMDEFVVSFRDDEVLVLADDDDDDDDDVSSKPLSMLAESLQSSSMS